VTQKQIERARKKIADIKRILTAEKRKLGCYDDSRGLRYLPTKYFIELADYSGGLRYLKWFDKNFPDDSGFPEFLFERAIIFFKTGCPEQAELSIFQTFFSNPYWFDKFFGKPITLIDMWHSSNLTKPDYTEALDYSSTQIELNDFALWLNTFLSTDDFVKRSSKYINIYKRLKTETDKEIRHYLVRQALQLEQVS
jgi:hypothetical protein